MVYIGLIVLVVVLMVIYWVLMSIPEWITRYIGREGEKKEGESGVLRSWGAFILVSTYIAIGLWLISLIPDLNEYLIYFICTISALYILLTGYDLFSKKKNSKH